MLRPRAVAISSLRNRRAMVSTGRGYADALEKLASLSSNRSTTSLFETRSTKNLNAAAIPEMVTWLRRAGYTPQDLCRMRHIHVAGTKGKGSTCAYATAMLSRRRSLVGTYTSPHLVSPRERIAINGEPVGREVFADAFFEVWDRLGQAGQGVPFYFRFLTILAWHIFLKQGVRDVVMECGIGGEYDATNVLPAGAVSAAVVTQLGVDHVAMLGGTVEEVTWHKAGIFKSGVKAFVVRDPRESVMRVLRERAAERGATLVELEEWEGVRGGMMGGEFQKRNQVLAVAAVREHLGEAWEDVPGDMIQGLREAKIRGRCETVEEGGVTWLLDGAHTRDSLEEVAKWFKGSCDGEAVLVFNQQERDAAELLGVLLEAAGTRFKHAIFTRNEVRAGEKAENYLRVQEAAADRLRSTFPACGVSVFDNVTDAVGEARRLSAGGKRKILVTGSLHLVGGVLQVLEPESSL